MCFHQETYTWIPSGNSHFVSIRRITLLLHLEIYTWISSENFNCDSIRKFSCDSIRKLTLLFNQETWEKAAKISAVEEKIPGGTQRYWTRYRAGIIK